MDGKQRFEAIFDFFDGKIVLNEDFVFLEDATRRLAGLSYKDIQANHRDAAEIFENYNLNVVSVTADDEEPINELFIRLNRSKSLTGAEVRNAMLGPVPGIIRELARDDFFLTNVRFSVKRGADLNAAVKILLFEHRGKIGETKKRNLDGFVRDVTKESKDSLELAARRVLELLGVMAEIFLPKDLLLGSSGVVPVYYWFIKNKRKDDFPYLREFLVDFERRRRDNRRLANSPGSNKKIRNVLIDYDRYNRSTNDEQSHKERVRILDEQFGMWKKSKKL